MPIPLAQFLEERGFQRNPFASTNAEQEAELLASYFVRAPWFDQLVGNPKYPESLILFAPQGFGKTSHRIEVSRRASGLPTAAALTITLNDFSMVTQSGIEKITIDTYVAVLRRLCIEALQSSLKQSVERLHQLEQHADRWLYYWALLHLYAPRRVLSHPISSELQAYMDALQQAQTGPKEWLKELAALASVVGYASVYVLLDGIDELHLTKGDSVAMLQLIRPLLEAPGLLQECGFAFKFFLPQEVETPMRERNIGRLDRIPSYSLVWSTDQLVDMLSKRLESHSLMSSTNPNALVSHFHNLCAVSYDIDLKLAEAAQTSPRRMLDLARQIVVEHCKHASDPRSPITDQSIQAVLGYDNPVSMPTITTTLHEIAQSITSSPAGVPLLYLDERGDVWIGELSKSEPLAPLLRKCLSYLWQHRQRSVSYEEMKIELYGASHYQRGDPQSSLEKLIRRLRSYLEEGKPSSHTYIDVQAGTGYVMRNVRDD